MHGSEIWAYPFALIRTPIRSYKRFLALHRAPNFRQAVLDLYSEEGVDRALRANSRTLWETLHAGGPESPPLSDDAVAALYRYFARMTTRSTPLMMFAGVGTASVGAFESLQQAPESTWQLGIFPSGTGIESALRRLRKSPAVRRVLRYRLNETTLRRGGILFYFTEKRQDGAARSTPRYTLASLRCDSELLPILREPSRSYSWTELVELIAMQREDVSPADVAAYIAAMVDCGILFDELQPPCVGPRPEEFLHAVAANQPELQALTTASASMLQLSAQPAAVCGASFASWWSALEQHPFTQASAAPQEPQRRAGLPSQAVLHIDVRDGGVPRPLVTRLGEVVSTLPRLWLHHHDAYRRAITRYLLQGTIGKRTPLLELVYRVPTGPNFVGRRVQRAEFRQALRADAERSPIDDYFRQRCFAADAENQKQIEIDAAGQKLLGDANGSPRVLPNFVESLFRLVHLDGRSALLHYSTISQVGCLLNRFLLWNKNDAMLAQLREIWRTQEAAAAPAILAEVTCGGGGRLPDLSHRPLTYCHQIVVNGAPSVPPEYQIHLGDLSVYLDEQSREPVLFWERKGVPIIARKLTALVTSSFSPVVEALVALDAQPLEWALRIDPDELPIHAPRITCRGIILQPRSWLVPPHLRDALQAPSETRDETTLHRLLAQWRERYDVPRIVRLGSADHNAVDLDGPMALRELAGMIDKGLSRVLEEFFEETSPIVGDDGPLVGEVVAHIRLRTGDAERQSAPLFNPPSLIEQPSNRFEQVFSPGAPWLFLKLYYGAGFGSDAITSGLIADDLLGRFVAPLIADLEARRLIDNFHFVRYADPESHLRLRLQPRDCTALTLLDALRGKIDAEMREQAFDRWVVATYEREVDRYGGAQLIAHAERLFTADSRLCLQLLSAFYDEEIDEEAELQRLIPICTLNALFRGFGYDLAARNTLFREMRTRHAGLRLDDKTLRAELDALYRKESRNLQSIIERLEGSESAHTALRPEIFVCYFAYEQRVREVAATYHDAARSGALSRSIPDIVAACFHMHCNRLLGSEKFEAQAIYLSQRAVEGICARRKKGAD